MEVEEKEILDIKKISLKKILNPSIYNKAELLNDEERNKIAELCLQVYEDDKNSRADKENRWKDIKELLKDKPKRVAKDGKANVIYPLIKQACKKWSSEAYPLVFQNGEVVKAKSIGRDDGEEAINPIDNERMRKEDGTVIYKKKAGAKAEKGQRRADFDNFVFMKKVKDYEKNTDLMLFRLSSYGTFFKKIYWDAQKKIIRADILFPQDVVVNYSAIDDEYTTYTQELYLKQNEVEAYKRIGKFLDVKLVKEESKESEVTGDIEQYTNYQESPQSFIEQHTWLDLDKDGFTEPYICIVHKESRKLLCIIPRFTEDDIEKNDKQEITNINAKNYFVKYDFVPTNDDTFYSDGFGDLLFHANDVINTILNQLLDAGTLANSSQGFVSKALKQQAGDLELGIGTFKFIDTMGISPREAIIPIDHKEPSIVLFQLLQFLLSSSKEIAGTNPALADGTNPNIAPMTMMAFTEEGSREFKAIYKRIYRSLTKEIEFVEDIIRDNADIFRPMYSEVLDDKEANFDEDYDNSTYGIVPVSDIDAVTSFEKIQKAGALLDMLERPNAAMFLNGEEVVRKALIYGNYRDVTTLVKAPPPAQPDPQMIILQQQQEIELEKIKSERMRIELASMESKRKIAEGAVKAQESGYKMAEMEKNIENIVANTIKTYLEGYKISQETKNLSMEQAEQKVDALYEPTE